MHSLVTLQAPSMQVTLASPRGYCAGVNMAIECLDKVIRMFGSNIYVYHEIVHNRHVVDRFTAQGVTFVDHMQQVPEGSILLFSAHGVSPEIRNAAKERKLQTIDATCPLVTKVHLEALRFARDGYHIVLIGHEGHDEVVGTMGEAPQSITLVETPEDVDSLSFEPDQKIAFLTQTTLSVDEAAAVIERLEQRFPNIASPPKEDICYATTNRQEAVKAMAPKCDAMLVVGAPNSSNSKRLVEVGARAGCAYAQLVQRADDIDWRALDGIGSIGITAGASAPEVLINEVIDAFKSRYDVTTELVETAQENVEFKVPRVLRQPA